MIRKPLLTALCLALLQLAVSAQKADWRELLAKTHSVETTYSEVVRLLNKTGKDTPTGGKYFVLREGEFIIFFTRDGCSVIQNGQTRAVPANIVMHVSYFPRKPFPKSEIPFNTSDFEIFQTDEVWGGHSYQNKSADSMFRTNKKGNVTMLLFRSAAGDVRCRSVTASSKPTRPS